MDRKQFIPKKNKANKKAFEEDEKELQKKYKDQLTQLAGQSDNDDNSDQGSESFSDDSNQSDKADYRQLKKEAKNKTEKKKKNIGQVLDTLLKKKTKNDGTILQGKKSAFKKVDEEKQKLKEIRDKKKQKMTQKRLGYRPIAEWDKSHEKNLSKITTKGVVKLFNSIFEFRKKIRDDKQKEETVKERKSTNFLMMHNLDPTLAQNKLKKSNNKSYEEDQ